VIGKPGSVVGVDEVVELYEHLYTLQSGKRARIYVETAEGGSIGKAALEEFATQRFSDLIVAVGVYTRSVVGLFFVELFLKLYEPHFPLRFFRSKDECLAWLEQFDARSPHPASQPPLNY
jgi:hypothetical protein